MAKWRKWVKRGVFVCSRKQLLELRVCLGGSGLVEGNRRDGRGTRL